MCHGSRLRRDDTTRRQTTRGGARQKENVTTALPQELIDAIVGHVNDPTTLKACSLVARRFVGPSQRTFFRFLRLYKREVWPAYKALKARLVASPHLAAYIHDLDIDLPVKGELQCMVASILRSLPNIGSLVVSGRGAALGDMRWDDLSPVLITALRDVVTQPSLAHFRLDSIWDITPSFILHVTASVSILTLFAFGLISSEGSHSVVEEFPQQFDPALTSLVVKGERTTELGDVLLNSPAYVTRLERLHIKSQSPQRLLLAAASSLQHLRIEDADLLAIPLPHIPHLHTLEIEVGLPDRGVVPARLHSILAKIAEALPSVEVIVLHCWISSRAPEQAALPGPSALHFPQLRAVQCELSRHDFGHFCTALEEAIPALLGLVSRR